MESTKESKKLKRPLYELIQFFIGVIASLASALTVVGIENIKDFHKVPLVVWIGIGFSLLTILFILLIRRIITAPRTHENIISQIADSYLNALDSSLLNPEKSKGL
ncbi:MAG: hypothetical protein ACE5HI_19860 [bacterium]